MPDYVRPNLFLAGTPKAATTSLSEWLAQHPQIHMSPFKEPWFFNDDRSTSRYVGKRKAYMQLFPHSEGVEWYCEATPDYLYSPNALERIEAFSENAKYLISFRRHSEAFFSLHQQERWFNLEDIEDPAEALAACADRRAAAKRKGRPVMKSLYYDERLRIGAQLFRALEFVERADILLIDFDLVSTDPDRLWRAMLSFLGLDYTPVTFNRAKARKVIATGPMATGLRWGKRLKNTLGIRGKTEWAHQLRLRLSPVDAAPPRLNPALGQSIETRFRYDRQLVEAFARMGPAIVSDTFYTKDGIAGGDSAL